MIKIAVYGKGGIGKSTLACNLSSAFSEKNLKVMQIGCDPKADSTKLLLNDRNITSVLELMRTKKEFALEEMVEEGYSGVICAESGGPVPGLGCAGRGIITALEKLTEKGAFEKYSPDVVIYDVLGDVVCGGFTMPMRKGYADRVFIVSSGEKMSCYAGANIAMAVENFKSRGYAQLGGIIYNHSKDDDDRENINRLCKDFATEIVGEISFSEEIRKCSQQGKTVLEMFPQSQTAVEIRELAEKIIQICGEEKC